MVVLVFSLCTFVEDKEQHACNVILAPYASDVLGQAHPCKMSPDAMRPPFMDLFKGSNALITTIILGFSKATNTSTQPMTVAEAVTSCSSTAEVIPLMKRTHSPVVGLLAWPLDVKHFQSSVYQQWFIEEQQCCKDCDGRILAIQHSGNVLWFRGQRRGLRCVRQITFQIPFSGKHTREWCTHQQRCAVLWCQPQWAN